MLVSYLILLFSFVLYVLGRILEKSYSPILFITSFAFFLYFLLKVFILGQHTSNDFSIFFSVIELLGIFVLFGHSTKNVLIDIFNMSVFLSIAVLFGISDLLEFFILFHILLWVLLLANLKLLKNFYLIFFYMIETSFFAVLAFKLLGANIYTFDLLPTFSFFTTPSSIEDIVIASLFLFFSPTLYLIIKSLKNKGLVQFSYILYLFGSLVIYKLGLFSTFYMTSFFYLFVPLLVLIRLKAGLTISQKIYFSFFIFYSLLLPWFMQEESLYIIPISFMILYYLSFDFKREFVFDNIGLFLVLIFPIAFVLRDVSVGFFTLEPLSVVFVSLVLFLISDFYLLLSHALDGTLNFKFSEGYSNPGLFTFLLLIAINVFRLCY